MRVFLGLGALSLVAGGCLLVTSLDGLEGPPLGRPRGNDDERRAAPRASLDASTSDVALQNDALIDNDGSTADGAPGGPIVFRDRQKGGTLRGLTVDKDGVYWAGAQSGNRHALRAQGWLEPARAPRSARPTCSGMCSTSESMACLFTGPTTRPAWCATDRSPGATWPQTYFNGAGHAAYLAMADNSHVLLTDNNLNIAAVVYGPPSLAVANNQGPPATGIAYAKSVVYWAYGHPSAIATSDITGTMRNDNFYVPPMGSRSPESPATTPISTGSRTANRSSGSTSCKRSPTRRSTPPKRSSRTRPTSATSRSTRIGSTSPLRSIAHLQAGQAPYARPLGPSSCRLGSRARAGNTDARCRSLRRPCVASPPWRSSTFCT